MPKKHQNDPRSGQKRPQEEPKTTKKAIPNDKTKKGPNQDDLWSVLDRPGADLPTIHALPGCHLGGQNGTKIDPKTIKNRSEKSRRKKPIQDDLGPVLGRSWAVLGAILGPWKCSRHYACRCFVNIHFFEDESIQRRSWDQLWPTKAPK